MLRDRTGPCAPELVAVTSRPSRSRRPRAKGRGDRGEKAEPDDSWPLSDVSEAELSDSVAQVHRPRLGARH